ncbi:MAG: dephospho-CoA kinase [Thermoanaerobaculia bacterium]|nr:dephospho-CoA kinase [Thermoanaerobaculia bacterium]
MASLTVGLTGGLAAGKSTVADRLRSNGLTVIDADVLVAELYAPGGDGAVLIASQLGSDFLDAKGGVDRAAVAQRVFRDAEARRALERGIHPLVRSTFEQRAADDAGIVVLEAALLVETGWGQQLDVLVTVEAPVAVRLERAAARDGDPEDAARRIAAQGPEEARRAAADYVIENDADLSHLLTQVDDLVVSLRKRAQGG